MHLTLTVAVMVQLGNMAWREYHVVFESNDPSYIWEPIPASLPPPGLLASVLTNFNVIRLPLTRHWNMTRTSGI